MCVCVCSAAPCGNHHSSCGHPCRRAPGSGQGFGFAVSLNEYAGRLAASIYECCLQMSGSFRCRLCRFPLEQLASISRLYCSIAARHKRRRRPLACRDRARPHASMQEHTGSHGCNAWFRGCFRQVPRLMMVEVSVCSVEGNSWPGFAAGNP